MNNTATERALHGNKDSRCTSVQSFVRLSTMLLLGTSMLTSASKVTLAQQGSILLDDITVIGTRTEETVQNNPRSVTVVDQQQLEREAPESIAEVLRDVPGLEVVDASAPGMKRLRIRGESSRRVTIMVDGQQITDHSSYGTPILVNPAAVERIDVIRGPASTLYGAKAIGGVVNIITKKGADKPVQVELGATYYSGTDGLQGWASVSGTSGAFDYRVTGGVADHDDQRTPEGEFTSTGYLDNTAFSNDDISAHIGYTFGINNNHYISLKAEQFRLETESWSDPALITGMPPTVSGLTNFDIDLPQRDRKKVGIFYDGKDLSNTVKKLHFDAYYQEVERQFSNSIGVFLAPSGFGVPTGTTTAVATSDDTITNYGGTAQIDLELLSNHYTIFGVHYLADVLETNKTLTESIDANLSFPVFPPFGPPIIVTVPVTGTDFTSSFDKARTDTISVFAQDRWKLTDDLTLTAGLRYDHVTTKLEETHSQGANAIDRSQFLGSSSEGVLLSSVSLTYDGIENTTLRALYSEGYITPTLLQLFGFTSAGGTSIYGNPELESETARNYEIGLRYDNGGLVVDATGYYIKSKDYAAVVQCGTVGTVCPGGDVTNSTYVNVDEAVTYGAELLLQYTFPGTQITPYATGAWTRRRLDFMDFSTYNTNVPELSGRFGVRYAWEMFGIQAWSDLFIRAASDVSETLPDATAANGRITDQVDSWATLNFAFGGTFGTDEQFKLAVEVNNITDEEYRPLLDALPGVGRSVNVTARMKF